MHAHWLGVDWKTDAAQTRQALGNEPVDWLIVDHYALDFRWESALRSFCKRMMVIDDLADRNHHCDLLLDHNYGSFTKRYAGLVPTSARSFVGQHLQCSSQSMLSGALSKVLAAAKLNEC